MNSFTLAVRTALLVATTAAAPVAAESVSYQAEEWLESLKKTGVTP